jgi:dimethylglycine dehydrogenase
MTFSPILALSGASTIRSARNYSASGDEPTFEYPSFRRSNSIRRQRAKSKKADPPSESRAAQFGKYRITDQRRDWLNWIMAGRIPKLSPRVNLMLSHKGKLLGDFTVSCLADKFHLTGVLRCASLTPALFLQHQERRRHNRKHQ